MSSSVVGKNGTRPLVLVKEIQRENRQLPLMVHIGNNPPNLDEIADLLTRGDIITHCYNGKPNRILTPSVRCASRSSARCGGVLLDVGHGTASFSFEVARRAIKLGILPHTISSDIYCRNRMNGPVHSGDGDVQIFQRRPDAAAGDRLRDGERRVGAAAERQRAVGAGL